MCHEHVLISSLACGALQVEEGCGLATAEDIAAAVHHVLCIIDAEASSRAAGPLAT